MTVSDAPVDTARDAATAFTPLAANGEEGEAHNVSPLQRHGVIQADQFCPCGYNLHGQRIERDERLGFQIVRCPECGNFQPAGHGSTAMRPWLSRLAAGLLVLWILFLLGIAAAAVGIFTGMSFAGIEMHTQWVQFDGSTNRPLAQTWDPNTQTSVYTYLDTGETFTDGTQIRWEMRHVPRNHPWAVAHRENNGWGSSEPPTLFYILFYGGLALIAFSLGVGQSAALWHLRGWRRWLPMAVILPLPAAFLLISLADGNMYADVSGLVLMIGGLHLGLAAVCYATGLLVGRPIARFVVKLLVPPRPRQMLAFLWHADGKQLPAAR